MISLTDARRIALFNTKLKRFNKNSWLNIDEKDYKQKQLERDNFAAWILKKYPKSNIEGILLPVGYKYNEVDPPSINSIMESIKQAEVC